MPSLYDVLSSFRRQRAEKKLKEKQPDLAKIEQDAFDEESKRIAQEQEDAAREADKATRAAAAKAKEEARAKQAEANNAKEAAWRRDRRPMYVDANGDIQSHYTDQEWEAEKAKKGRKLHEEQAKKEAEAAQKQHEASVEADEDVLHENDATISRAQQAKALDRDQKRTTAKRVKDEMEQRVKDYENGVGDLTERQADEARKMIAEAKRRIQVLDDEDMAAKQEALKFAEAQDMRRAALRREKKTAVTPETGRNAPVTPPLITDPAQFEAAASEHATRSQALQVEDARRAAEIEKLKQENERLLALPHSAADLSADGQWHASLLPEVNAKLEAQQRHQQATAEERAALNAQAETLNASAKAMQEQQATAMSQAKQARAALYQRLNAMSGTKERWKYTPGNLGDELKEVDEAVEKHQGGDDAGLQEWASKERKRILDKAQSTTGANLETLWQEWGQGTDTTGRVHSQMVKWTAKDGQGEYGPVHENFSARVKELGLDEKQAREYLETRRQMDWSTPLDPEKAKQAAEYTRPLRERFGLPILDPVRKLPNGAILPNPVLGADKTAFEKAIADADGTPEQKAEALKKWPEYRRNYGEGLLTTFAQQSAFGEDFNQWREENSMASTDPVEQALAYEEAMRGRNVFRRWGDVIVSNLTAGFMDVTQAGLGSAAALTGWVPGMQGLSELAAANSRNANSLVAGQEQLSGTGMGGSILGAVARMAPGVAATVGTGSMAGATVFGAAQTGGMLYGDAYGKLRDEGKTHAEAWRASAPASVVAGSMTALLTRLFPGGAEALVNNAEARAGVRAMIAGAMSRGKAVVKGALDEIPEELIDEGVSQLAQGYAEGKSADEAVTEFITGLPEIVAAAGLMGGGMQAVKDRMDQANTPAQAPVDKVETPPAGTESVAPADAAVARPAKAAPEKPDVLKFATWQDAAKSIDNDINTMGADEAVATVKAAIQHLENDSSVPPDVRQMQIEKAKRRLVGLEKDSLLKKIAEKAKRAFFDVKSWLADDFGDDGWGHVTTGDVLVKVVLDGDGSLDPAFNVDQQGIFVNDGPGQAARVRLRNGAGMAPLVFDKGKVGAVGIKVSKGSEPVINSKLPLSTMTEQSKARALDVILNELEASNTQITAAIVAKIARALGVPPGSVMARLSAQQGKDITTNTDKNGRATRAAAEAEIAAYTGSASMKPHQVAATKAKAGVLLRMAQGETLADFSDEELRSVGLNRDGSPGHYQTVPVDKKNPEAGSTSVWKKGPRADGFQPVVVEDGELIITQRQIDNLTKNLPAVAAQIGLSEVERRKQIAAAKSGEQRAESPAEADKSVRAPVEDAIPMEWASPAPAEAGTTNTMPPEAKQRAAEIATVLEKAGVPREQVLDVAAGVVQEMGIDPDGYAAQMMTDGFTEAMKAQGWTRKPSNPLRWEPAEMNRARTGEEMDKPMTKAEVVKAKSVEPRAESPAMQTDKNVRPTDRRELSAREDWRKAREAGLSAVMKTLQGKPRDQAKAEFAKITTADKVLVDLVDNRYGALFDEVRIGKADTGLAAEPLEMDAKGRATRVALVIDPEAYYKHGGLAPAEIEAALDEELRHRVDLMVSSRQEAIDLARAIHAARPSLFEGVWSRYFALGIQRGDMPATPPKVLDDATAYLLYFEATRMIHQGVFATETIQDVGLLQQLWRYLNAWLKAVRREMRKLPRELQGEWNARIEAADKLLKKIEKRATALDKARLDDVEPPASAVRGQKSEGRSPKADPELDAEIQAAWEAEEKERRRPVFNPAQKVLRRLRSLMDPDNDEVNIVSRIAMEGGIPIYSEKVRKMRKQANKPVGGEMDWLERADIPPFWKGLLFSKGSVQKVDTMLEMLHKEGYFPDAATPADVTGEMLAEKIAAVLDRYKAVQQGLSDPGDAAEQEGNDIAKLERQRVAFDRATASGPIEVQASQLTVGDRMQVKGPDGQLHPVEVIALDIQPIPNGETFDPEGNPAHFRDAEGRAVYLASVTLKDGTTFGVQQIDGEQGLFVDQLSFKEEYDWYGSLREAIQSRKLDDADAVVHFMEHEGIPSDAPWSEIITAMQGKLRLPMAKVQKMVATVAGVRLGTGKKRDEMTAAERQIGIVWHASPNSFDVFDTSKEGAHFGTAEQAGNLRGKGKTRSKPYLLNLQNPLRVPDLGTFNNFNNVFSYLSRNDIVTPQEADAIWDGWNRSDDIGWEILKQTLEAKGFDGFVYQNEVEGDGDSYTAWRSNQIRSAPTLYTSRKRDLTGGLFGADEMNFLGDRNTLGLFEQKLKPDLEKVRQGEEEKKPVSPSSFTLEPTTKEELDAEARREELKRKLRERQDKPLTGTQGDIGQGQLFGGGDLFAPPPAVDTVKHAPATPGSVEPDRAGSPAGDGSGTRGVQSERPAAGGDAEPVGTGRAGGENAAVGGDPAAGGAAADGGAGNAEPVQAEAPRVPGRPAGNPEPRGSGAVDDTRAAVESAAELDLPPVAPERPATDTVAAERDASLESRLTDQARAQADEGVWAGFKVADADSIARSLPMLLPQQQQDVLKAERRFFVQAPTESDPKKGILFTNGTGTGKTFTGLGIIKRFEMMGKNRVLIVVPSQQKVTDWRNEGARVQVKVNAIQDTNDAGEDVVVTTYANLRDNPKLQSQPWDLVVYDESHYLSSNAQGNEGANIAAHELATGKGRAAQEKWTQAVLGRRPDWADEKAVQRYQNAAEQASKRIQYLMDTAPDTKAVFLSATPFAYHKNLKYADGFLYASPPHTGKTAYNTPQGFDRYLVENFGYTMKTNRLNQPPPEVDTGLMEREWAERQFQQGSMSGRMIDVPYDYSREFVLLNSETGRLLDDGFRSLSGWESADRDRWPDLTRAFNAYWRSSSTGYTRMMQFMESIKVADAIDRMHQHLALGRKIVLFHSYNNADPIHPFQLGYLSPGFANDPAEQIEKARVLEDQARDWMAAHPALVQMNFKRLQNPRALVAQEFEDRVKFFNGEVGKRERAAAIEQFNRDDSGVDIFMVQTDAGKEGISLHDTTGKKQRVLMNASLPVKPTDAIQEEGRIYRIGVLSNAIQEYLVLHTNMERSAFGSKISQRTGTVENMALGQMARTLTDSFKSGYLNAHSEDPSAEQGLGGKKQDAAELLGDDFTRAKSYYFGRMKKTSRNKAAEGQDYFATPEPLGLVMVRMLEAKPGMDLLEPSAGHGAIGRWFPDTTANKFVEPSRVLADELRIKVASGKVEVQPFEELHIANKFDGVAMNPPFGTAGKLAIEHLAKASRHLRQGGRLVAIIPEGPAMQKRFDAWLEAEGADMHLRASYGLPTVTFERAGTSVKTRLVVLDKADLWHLKKDDGGAWAAYDSFGEKRTRNFPYEADAKRMAEAYPDFIAWSNAAGFQNRSPREIQADDVKEFFDEIEHLEAPARITKNVATGEVSATRPAPLPATGNSMSPAPVPADLSTVSVAAQFLAGGRGAVLPVSAPAPAPAPAPSPAASTYEAAQTLHAKKGVMTYVAKILRRLTDSEYQAEKNRARQHGGYYSAFKGNGAIPGFQFDTAEKRDAFTQGYTGQALGSARKRDAAPVPALTRASVFAHRLAVAKREIEQDMQDGTVPPTVTAFRDLHDHVDANLYVNDAERGADRQIGPLGRSLGWKTQDYADFTNELIEALDAWLRSGRPADVSPSPSLPVSQSSTDAAAHEAATSPQNDLREPTPAQMAAGNYQKGHVTIAGHEISIENPAGSKRRPEWPALQDHYGYFKSTNAKDGDHVDVFVKPGTPEDYAGPVHVVRQNKVETVKGQKVKTGQFDEYKVMLGYPTAEEARAAYLRNYEPGWPGLHKLTTHSMAEFQKIKDQVFTVPADRVPGVRETDKALASAPKRGSMVSMADPDKAAQANEPSPGGLSEAWVAFEKKRKSAREDRARIIQDAEENKGIETGSLSWEKGDDDGIWHARTPDGDLLTVSALGDKFLYYGSIRDRENATWIEFEDYAPTFEKAVEYAEAEAGVAQSTKNYRNEAAWESSINALIDTFTPPPGVHDFKFTGSGPGKLGAFRRSMSLYGDGYYDHGQIDGEDHDGNKFRFSVRDHEPTEKWQQIYGYLDHYELVDPEMKIASVAQAIDDAEEWLASQVKNRQSPPERVSTQKSQSRPLTGQAGESKQDMLGSGPSKTGFDEIGGLQSPLRQSSGLTNPSSLDIKNYEGLTANSLQKMPSSGIATTEGRPQGLDEGDLQLPSRRLALKENPTSTPEVNTKSAFESNSLAAGKKRAIRPNPLAKPGEVAAPPVPEVFTRPEGVFLKGMANADWNRLDKAITNRLGRVVATVAARLKKSPKATDEDKGLDWLAAEALEGLEHAAGTPITDAKQRESALDAIKEQMRKAWKATLRQFMPDATVPADVKAKLIEMRASIALSQEKALDVSKRVLENRPKLVDVLAGKNAEAFQNPEVRRKMYLAMNAKIDSGVTMDDLTPEQREVAQALKQVWWENGMRRVRNGTLRLDTFQDMAEGMPQFYEEDVNLEKGFIPRFLKLGLKGLVAQRSTRFHIIDKSSKDKKGEFALVDWTDPATKRKDWKFKSKAHMDAAYGELIESQILAAKDARQADYGKLSPDDIRTLRQYTWMTDADRAALAGVTREKLRSPATLTKEQAAVVERMTEQLHRRFQKKNPLKYDQHQKAGLIEDPFYAIARALLESGHDNATAEFFNYVAKQPDYVRDAPENGFTEMQDDPRLGRLAGKWVRDDVAAELTQMLDLPNMVMRFYDWLLAGFKYGHTILNAGSHVRNVIGNVAFAQLAGSNPLNPGNWKAYAEANRLLREGGPTFEALHKLGVIGGDYLTAEVRKALRQLLPDPDTVERMIAAGDMSWLTGLKEQMARKSDKLGKVLGKITGGAESAWKWEDDIYKVSAFIKARQQGMTEEEAAAHVRKWFPYYDKGTSGSLKALGRFVFPFLSFKRESLRIMGHALKERPVSFLTMMALPRLITQLSLTALELQLLAAGLGLEDEDKEDLLKALKGRAGGLLAPFTDASLFAIALPVMDGSGGMMQWDLSAAVPWSDWLSTRIEHGAEQPWFQRVADQIVSGAPFLSLVGEMWRNQDAFSGRRLWEDDMSSGEKHLKVAAHAYMKLTPPLLGPHIASMMRSMEQQPSKLLPQRNPAMQFARIMGLDIKPLSPDLYRKAEEFRKSKGAPVPPRGGQAYPKDAASRARARLYMELIQPEIDTESADEAFAALEGLGEPVRSLKDLHDLFKDRNAETLLPAKMRNEFVRGLPPASRRVYDAARDQQAAAFKRSSALMEARKRMKYASPPAP